MSVVKTPFFNPKPKFVAVARDEGSRAPCSGDAFEMDQFNPKDELTGHRDQEQRAQAYRTTGSETGSLTSFYRDFVWFAICFSAYLLPLIWALDDLSSLLQNFSQSLVVPNPQDPNGHHIETVYARIIVFLLYTTIFMIYWFGRNFLHARRSLTELLAVSRTNPDSSDISEHKADILNEKEKHINRLSNEIQRQRLLFKKIQYQMYEENIRPRDDLVCFNALYLVNAIGDIEVTKEVTIISPELEVHFWRFHIDGDDYADRIDDETDLSLEAELVGEDTTEVIPILIDSRPTRKEYTVNFLPAIKPLDRRSFLIRYRWAGFFRELIETGRTNYIWKINSYSNRVNVDFTAEWRFHSSIGGVLCESTGANPPGMALKPKPDANYHIWQYSGKQVPIGATPMELRFFTTKM